MTQVQSSLTATQLQALTTAAGKLLSGFTTADAAAQAGLASLESAINAIPGLTDAATQSMGAVRADGSVTLQFPGVASLHGVTFIFDPAILTGGQALVFAVEYQPSAALVASVLGQTPLAGLQVAQPAIVASTGVTTSFEGATVGAGLNLIESVNVPASDSDPLLYSLHNVLGVKSADVVVDLHQSYGTITGTAHLAKDFKVGATSVTLGDVSFAIDRARWARLTRA